MSERNTNGTFAPGNPGGPGRPRPGAADASVTDGS